MRRDPFFFIWTFPGLRITLTPGAGTFTGSMDLELLPRCRMEYDRAASLNFAFADELSLDY